MSRGVTLAGYVVLGLAAAAYQLVALATRRTAGLGDALRPLKRSLAGRLLLLVVWMWVGWHLFARASWR